MGTGERSGKRGRRSCLTLQLVREDIRGDVRVGLGGRVEREGAPDHRVLLEGPFPGTVRLVCLVST